MIEIREYNNLLFDDAVDIFTQLSAYHLGDNASDSKTVAANLKNNILGGQSAMNLLLAYCNGSVCALAAYAILYPATKETGQLFLKELFVSQAYIRKGVGEHLMSYIARLAIHKNCSRFDWTANEDSEKAAAFYEKLQAPILKKKQYYRLTREDLQRVANQHYPNKLI